MINGLIFGALLTLSLSDTAHPYVSDSTYAVHAVLLVMIGTSTGAGVLYAIRSRGDKRRAARHYLVMTTAISLSFLTNLVHGATLVLATPSEMKHVTELAFYVLLGATFPAASCAGVGLASLLRARTNSMDS